MAEIKSKPANRLPDVPREGGKKLGQRSVNPAAKRVGVGACSASEASGTLSLITRPLLARPARPRLHSYS